jgi:CDP-glucose 4,6-dehydratase
MQMVVHPYWREKRVLVTGCTGFIGSWLVRGLLQAGAEVVGLVRDQVPFSQLVRSGDDRRIRLVSGDVTDYELMERVMAEYEIESVFHLAAQTIVTIANRTPLSTFETNIKVSKSCADLIAQAYARTYKLPAAVTRFANIYGGGDLNWNRIVPGTIRSALRGERPIIRSDGTFRRDYLFVEDAVAGYLTLAEKVREPQIQGQCFNFGQDRPTTVLEMVQTIIELVDCTELEPIILDEVKNEIPDQYLASERAHRLLGWSPSHTLAAGLEKSIAWYRDFLSADDSSRRGARAAR